MVGRARLLLVAAVAAAGAFTLAVAVRRSTNEVSTRKVASYAVRAVARAGLLDTTRHAYDYNGVEVISEGWLVTFTPYDCRRRLKVGRCERLPGGDVLLWVAQRDGNLTIVRTSVPIKPATTARLVGYEERALEEPPRLEFPVVQIEKYSRGVAAQGSPLWTGSIPAEGYRSSCRAVILDENGETIHESASFSVDLPTKEYGRSGGIIPSDVPSRLKASGARFTCQTDRS